MRSRGSPGHAEEICHCLQMVREVPQRRAFWAERTGKAKVQSQGHRAQSMGNCKDGHASAVKWEMVRAECADPCKDPGFYSAWTGKPLGVGGGWRVSNTLPEIQSTTRLDNMAFSQYILGAGEQNYPNPLWKVCEEVYERAVVQRSGHLTLLELVRAAVSKRNLGAGGEWEVRGTCWIKKRI